MFDLLELQVTGHDTRLIFEFGGNREAIGIRNGILSLHLSGHRPPPEWAQGRI
jgi:hypothetical protein